MESAGLPSGSDSTGATGLWRNGKGPKEGTYAASTRGAPASESGFTIVEVVAALLLLVIVVLATFSVPTPPSARASGPSSGWERRMPP
jgi:hypothetical protein